ncbi:MAG: glycosyltransferase N-terminal domain-containing protein [Chitinophagales bacterium]
MNFFFTFLYNLGIQFYHLGIVTAALWNRKAQRWLQGRKNQFEKIEMLQHENEYRAWFHCASAGEFEQGRPLMEAYRKQWPQHKIILTFFSPSGFELRKNYAGADHVFYLPLDTAANARKFVSLIKPRLAVFVKYEFWYHHLQALKQQHIPAILVSGIFRKEQLFFKWIGKPWRNVLHFFKHLFLQDEASLQLLQSINIQHATVAGDTRFDRVWQIAQQPKNLPIIRSFKGTAKIFVAGSTWPEDEKLLMELIAFKTFPWKWIIVPHELEKQHLEDLKSKWKDDAVFYSMASIDDISGKRILIVDEMGLLSSIYSYADMAYVGGGFGKGIHNIPEAAVYGIPVLFGPLYQQFNEAHALLKSGVVITVGNSKELITAFNHFAAQSSSFAMVNRNYIAAQKGATEKIIEYLQKISSNTFSSPA